MSSDRRSNLSSEWTKRIAGSYWASRFACLAMESQLEFLHHNSTAGLTRHITGSTTSEEPVSHLLKPWDVEKPTQTPRRSPNTLDSHQSPPTTMTREDCLKLPFCFDTDRQYSISFWAELTAGFLRGRRLTKCKNPSTPTGCHQHLRQDPLPKRPSGVCI
jgi:hypothetical protein